MRSDDVRSLLNPNLALGTEAQEWVALEGGLVLADPSVDGMLVFGWENIPFIRVLGFANETDAVLGIAVRQSNGEDFPIRVEANAEGMSALYEIACAAGVDGG